MYFLHNLNVEAHRAYFASPECLLALRLLLFPAIIMVSSLPAQMLGNGLGEQPAGMTEEEKTVVTKRLVLGIVASVGLGALSLVPTETLNLARPQKPLFFYLTPLLRIQGLLKELEAPVSAGEFLEAKAGLSRILGEPNNARQNMTNAKLLLTDAKTRLQVTTVGDSGKLQVRCFAATN